MNNYSTIYWLTRLDAINIFFAIMLFVSAISLLFYYIIYQCECHGEDDQKEYKKSYGIIKKISVPFVVVGIMVTVFLPNKNEAILIMAGGKTLDFVQNDTSLSKIPAQTTAIISGYMDKAIQELKKGN
jgi:hypothetical protein